MTILRVLILALAMSWVPAVSAAWWNGEWAHRVKITLNTADTGADIKDAAANVALLVRLHTGNFSFIDAKEDGADLRFVAADDKTPLKYHIEKFDAVNELALVWVQLPKLAPASRADTLWLYYGNAKAAPAQDAKATYDVNQTLVLHFGEKEGAPRDVTGYANHASQSSADTNATGLIGAGAGFNGEQRIAVAASPTLKLADGGGFTFTAWVKPAAGMKGVLFSQRDGPHSLELRLDDNRLYAELSGKGKPLATAPAEMAPGSWRHVAVTLSDRLVVYIDGKEAAAVDAKTPELAGEIALGEGYRGEMDEVTFSNAARSAGWVRAAAAGQGPDQKLVTYGQPEGGDSGGSTSYIRILLNAVTLDGWVVIGILLVMMIVSFFIMIGKALLLARTERANQGFLEEFEKLSGDLAGLDSAQAPAGASVGAMAVGNAFEHSTLHRLYRVGLRELQVRFEQCRKRGDEPNLNPQSVDAIRASLDAGLVRENNRLNSQMVLLTIAISGGPFLGLLGTVVGVMITFAAIAAVGDVNVNSIAPGIAAALVATVAGLSVAIPALFGYNYLASRIRVISSEMQVFADELVTKFAEAYAQ